MSSGCWPAVAAGMEGRLSQAAQGSTVTVETVLGDDAFRGRMLAIGIVPGAPIQVMEGGPRRPFLLAVSGGRFMLDWRSTQMIIVRTGYAGHGGERSTSWG